jgi:hypothetical protein
MEEQYGYERVFHWPDGEPVYASIVAPSDGEVEKGYRLISVSLGSRAVAQAGLNAVIDARMNVKEAEAFALKLLHACSIVRISAREQRTRGGK